MWLASLFQKGGHKMSKWWFKVPIILLCVLMVAGAVVFGKVAYAASGMPEFGQIITASLDALKITLEHLYEVLKLIW